MIKHFAVFFSAVSAASEIFGVYSTFSDGIFSSLHSNGAV
jgi:hypothetical protein